MWEENRVASSGLGNSLIFGASGEAGDLRRRENSEV